MPGAHSSVNQLPPSVLPTIQAIEGSSSGIASSDRNESGDLGVMQINMLWLDPLARHTYLPRETVLRAVSADCLHRRALNQGHKVKVLGAARVMFVTWP